MITIRRLNPGDEALALTMFRVVAAVFAEDEEQTFGDANPTLTEADAKTMLARSEFWAMVALDGDDVVGGVTAHTLAMTRARISELFIYDIAVRADRQRQGIGRMLMTTLLEHAERNDVRVAFVPADNEDAHALDFYRALGGVASPVTFFTFSR